MPIYDLFSKRKRRAERGDVPDVYSYDTVPEQLRVQVIHLWKEGFGKSYEGSFAFKVYKGIRDLLCREYGLFRLVEGRHGYDSYLAVGNHGYDEYEDECCGFLLACKPEQALDIIELTFSMFWNNAQRNSYPPHLGPKAFDALIAELNGRFKESGVGYQFESGLIIRVDSALVHAEVVKPALKLLFEEGFEGADEEFRSAFEHYRHGKHKEALVDALKAFESTMKTICKRKSWDYPDVAGARNLITIIFDKELIPQSMQAHFTGLRQTLEAGVPTVRNKLGGHGQGEEPVEVPGYLAAYALHLTASNLVMLLEAFKASS
ncbi:STM4504/CBY_0614 family protein [Hyalangium versicolor]|uniref:STM4504/CBY_0614 family protein n=1 Tax=Hyalangium versicolor TaxID=2861190 RepID=UPI001CCFAE0A|nr:hypothetical protein [Hyalangium versicolor]